ncbi:MAG TPA: branched-chain amino acid ABC transporter ATP-binding protein, partial [Rhodospirillaceae bacterium]|nr:branched-chain amino acid ABC transporter ATP-binding protein [Rhodospirillaceae bacterium]
VIGSNGAGKSTLMRRLAGLLPPTGGQITFEGQDISTLASHDLVGRGVVLVPEGRLIFSDMTVLENLTIGAVNPRARADRDIKLETVFDFFPRLKERRSQLGGTLSGGEQ